MRISSAVVLLPVLLAGCTVPNIKARSDVATTDDAIDAERGEEDDAVEIETKLGEVDTAPAEPDTVYTATLPEMEPHAFGHLSPDGKFRCYFTFFSDVQVKVTVNADGHVAAITFTGTSNEVENVSECNVVPMQPSRHTYSFRTDTPSGTAVSLVPAPENEPQASLTADVSVEARRLTLHWHRTDVRPPWDWSFTEQIELSRSEPVR